MILLFYGPNSYSLQKALKKELSGVRERNPNLAHQHFYLDQEGDVENLYNSIVSKGLFDEGKKSVLISDIDESSFENDLVKKSFQFSADDSSIILFVSACWDKKNFPDFISKLKNKTTSFKELYFDIPSRTGLSWKDLEYYAFVSKIAKGICDEKGVKIDSPAIILLLSFLDYDLFAFENEIVKLSYLNKIITKDFLLSLSEYKLKANFWDYAKDIISPSDLRRSFIALENIISQKIEPFSLFNYLAKNAKTKFLASKLYNLDKRIKSGLLEVDQALLEIVLK